tara:strand:+ start:1557 stop:2285 length:729 start_codon:yes stop_codon:yes gene_type:complete
MNINFIIPCYNEEKIIYNSIKYLLSILKNNRKINVFKITIIDDGSKDNTWNIIKRLNLEENRIKGIKLLTNYGHLSALNAGFQENNYDYVGMIDVDFYIELPNDTIDELIKHMSTNNYDIIQIVRDEYLTNKIFKSVSSDLFYLLYNFISNIKITSGAPDFRIINSNVIKKFNVLKYKILFRREIHAYNFKIKYLKKPQKINNQRKSKFTFFKMLNLALESFIYNTGYLTKKNDFIISERIK